MTKVVVNTTFRDFDGSINDKMQICFLKSLKRQTMQDYILVVTIFGERKVESTVRRILGNHCCFVYCEVKNHYKFSLSITFINGIDYGLQNNIPILLDCSSDIVLQKNFLQTVVKRCPAGAAGICHPNIFLSYKDGKKVFQQGKISRGIDARFYSIELFRDTKVYELLNRFPSYNYGASIEVILCGLAIKYAKKRNNIFMESKVIKVENDRGGSTKVSPFMREGTARNLPVVNAFLASEGLANKYMRLNEINKQYRVTSNSLLYHLMFLKEFFDTKYKS